MLQSIATRYISPGTIKRHVAGPEATMYPVK